MSSLLPVRLGLTTLALLLSVTALSAQGRGQKVTFKSFDKVDLIGTFYPSNAEGKRSPVVLLLHKLGGSSQDEGWETLAKTLQAKGLAVLSFDFRGHGESVAVEPDFWNLTTNARGIKGAGQPKITAKDFQPIYWPMLVNDIAAAKFFLEDKLNNSEECNVNELVVVAAEDGASIGALWIAAEWARKKPIYKYDAFTMRDVYVGEAPESAGRDIAAAVWLSLRTNLGGTKSQAPVLGWLSVRNAVDTLPVFQKVPMCFFHGEEDKEGSKLAKSLHAGIDKAKKLPTTFRVEMPKTNLAGSELLKGDIGTSEYIAQYIKDKVMKDRPMSIWTKRDTASCKLHLVPQQTLSQLGVRLP